MLFFKCLGYGCLGAPPGRPWAQSATPGRFDTANPIQPILAGELSGHRSGDRATDAPREPTTGHRSEDRVAEKGLQNNSYLGSYITAPGHRLGPRDAGNCFPPRVRGRFTTEDPIQPRGWAGCLLEILRAPRPAAPPRVPRGKFAFSFKPSRLAGAISADVRSAERACRSELIMRERRLRSE